MLPINTIIQGDFLEEIRKLPDESIDCVITDPPYGVDYQGGQNKVKRERLQNDKNATVYKDLFLEIKRVLKKDGSAYVFYANGKENEIFPYLDFYKYQVLIWAKFGKGFGDIPSRYHHTYEPFLYLCKNTPTNWYGKTNDVDIWSTQGGYKNDFHPTQKPIDIISKMIKNSTKEGDVVLDCFAGGGSTLIASKMLKRNYIGIEISPEYCKIAEERIKAISNPLF